MTTRRPLPEIAAAAGMTPDALLDRQVEWFGSQEPLIRQHVLGQLPGTCYPDLVQAMMGGTIHRLGELFNGPEHAEPHELSGTLMGAIIDLAARCGTTAEPFLRAIIAEYAGRLSQLEKDLRDGLVTLHGDPESQEITVQHVLYPPLPVRSNPTFEVRDASDFPPPNENVAWSTRVDWNKARESLDAGRAVVFTLDPPEMEEARAAVAKHLGHGYVTRLDITLFRLWIVRPEHEGEGQ